MCSEYYRIVEDLRLIHTFLIGKCRGKAGMDHIRCIPGPSRGHWELWTGNMPGGKERAYCWSHT